MRLINIEMIDEFLGKVKLCTGDVWLESVDGDRINLKSKLSRYVEIGALLSEEGSNLDLYCAKREDEMHFINFFEKYPDSV